MKGLMAGIALLALVSAAQADPVITPAVGGNVVTFETDRPSDFELGGALSSSLSPHISAVGGAWYGVGQTYLRGTAGVRITATDANDPNFSIGIGGQYNASSDPGIRPEGWDGDATVGWRPYPEKLPKVVVIAQGAYLFSTNEAYMMLGLRYALNNF